MREHVKPLIYSKIFSKIEKVLYFFNSQEIFVQKWIFFGVHISKIHYNLGFELPKALCVTLKFRVSVSINENLFPLSTSFTGGRIPIRGVCFLFLTSWWDPQLVGFISRKRETYGWGPVWNPW